MAGNLASAAVPADSRVTEVLSSSDFSSAITEFPEGRIEMASFAEFFRLAERLPLAEFPDAMARLGQLKGKWQARLLELWAIRSPKAARAWFEAQPQAERVKLFPEWADTWVRVDAAGLRQWLANRAEDEREQLSKGNSNRSWVDTLAGADPTAALQLAQLYPKLIYAPSVLQIWAARDPVAAAAAALELSAEQRATAANFIMSQWGSQDPEAALAWIDQQSDPALIDRARDGIVSALSRKDPAQALELIRSRFPADQQESHWRYVAAYASMKDPERIASLAQQQSDPKIRRTLVAEAIRFMTAQAAGVKGGLWPPAETEATIDAKRAADLWIAESNTAHEALPHIEQVAAALASQYGVDATIDFLNRMPPQLSVDTKDVPDWIANARGWNDVAESALNMQSGERRSIWLEKAVSGLAKQGDLTALQSLIDRLPSGTERDGVVRTFAAANFSDDPQESAALLLDLPDGRAQLEAEVARWLKKDLFEARRWITKTDVLTQEEKGRLLGSAATSSNGKKMMKANWIIPLLCLAIGFAAGFSQSGSSSEVTESGRSIPEDSYSSGKSDSRQAGAGAEDGWREEFTRQLNSIGFLPSRVQRSAELSRLLASLSLPELRRASELLDQLPKSFRSDARLLFAFRFLELDPQEAARFVQSQRDDSGNLAFFFTKEWQRSDPKAAISWFVQLSGKVDSTHQFRVSFPLREWASKEPQRAAELVMSSPTQFGEDGVNVVFGSWAKQNPKDAMEAAAALDNTRLQQAAMRAVLKSWVEQDPETALQWYEQLTDEVLRNQLAEGVAVGLAVKNRAQSLELVRSLPEGRVRDTVLTKVAKSLRSTALEESLEILREVPFEPGNAALKDYYGGLYYENAGAAVSSLFQRLESATDPDEHQAVEKFLKDAMNHPMFQGEAAANTLINAPGTAADPLRLDMVERVAGRWAQNDMPSARKWLESLPPGDARNRAITGVTLSWAWSAQAEASAWIDQQPPSASRDAAVSGYIKATLGRDPADSLARLRTMGDTAAQLATLAEGWRNWARRDRAAAEAWLNNSPAITPAERAALNPNKNSP